MSRSARGTKSKRVKAGATKACFPGAVDYLDRTSDDPRVEIASINEDIPTKTESSLPHYEHLLQIKLHYQKLQTSKACMAMSILKQDVHSLVTENNHLLYVNDKRQKQIDQDHATVDKDSTNLDQCPQQFITSKQK